MWQNLYNRLKEFLSTKYRIEFIEDVSLRQSYSFTQKVSGLLLIGGGAFLVIALLSICFVLFTPGMRRLIPGYEDPTALKEKQEELVHQIVASEERFTRIQYFLESIRTIAGGRPDSVLLDSLSKGYRPPAEPDYPETNTPQTDEKPVKLTNDEATPMRVVYTTNNADQGGARSFNPLLHLFPPIKGEISNGYNESKKHYGVDIIAADNTLIKSIADGFVVISEYSYETGHVIGIMSPGNLLTFYKHNSRLLKKLGDYVYAGEAVAVIGNSGENSSGPHLHLEMWQQGKAIDPAQYIPFR